MVLYTSTLSLYLVLGSYYWGVMHMRLSCCLEWSVTMALMLVTLVWLDTTDIVTWVPCMTVVHA